MKIFKSFPYLVLKNLSKHFIIRILRLFVIVAFNLLYIPLCFSQQVTVNINSGNPAFPFPQFQEYSDGTNHSLGNLATQNAPGLTHAEMEKQISEAWQIMANRFEYTGEEYSGVKYIRSNIGCPYDCSEGVGYALIGAALMGDKTTFDGIWFREHDIRRALYSKYNTCGDIIRPGYSYGQNSLPEPNGNTAADGDMDIALGLLLAWKQWGHNSGYTDNCGNTINYKNEALDIIRGLVEFQNQGFGDCRSVSGIVGLDGYFKGGDTWLELTNWATGQNPCPEFAGPTDQHIDYVSAGYFKVFADFLSAEGGTAEDINWNIPQLKRAEASTAWINGQLLNEPAALPLAGWVNVTGSTATFSSFNEGEDFRHAWRAGMNAMWHSDPSYTWDPVTHQTTNSPNSFERDISLRMASFLKDPSQSPWNNDCQKPGTINLTYQGPSQIVQQYDPNTGEAIGAFPLNWIAGTGSAAAVIAQDYELMGQLYRQCAITWDVTQIGDGYLSSVPRYFHGWFRLLGMLILSGNHPSPSAMIDGSNLKIYESADKTYAFPGDLITYTLSYRNYSSQDALNSTITCTLAPGLEFVSATNGGANSSGTITWDLGTVPGYRSSTGVNPTKGNVTLVCRISSGFSGRISNTAQINTSNGQGWTTNDYPNNITTVMERNSVDVVARALEIETSVSETVVEAGTNIIYQIDFENGSNGGYINGGREGVVVAYAHDGTPANNNQHLMKFRLYNGAAEPYIDYGNYRISMFINDSSTTCLDGTAGCANGWKLDNQIYEGGDKNDVHVLVENIMPGSDSIGSWNQRVVVQFSEQLATVTPVLSRYYGQIGRNIHQGGDEPLRAVWQMHNSSWGNINWSDDWSWAPGASDLDDGLYHPITNDWTNIHNPDLPVTSWHNEACETATNTVDNILVEEWDGYTWRRVFGNGPLPGRDVENVIVKDVLPPGVTFLGFLDENGNNTGNSINLLGETVGYDQSTKTISWAKNRLQVKQGGIIRYLAKADFTTGKCEGAAETKTNRASIEGKNESPKIASVDVLVTGTDGCHALSVCSLDAGTYAPICQGDPARLTATGSSNIAEWVDEAGKILTEKDANGFEVISTQPIVKPEINTTYTVKGIKGNNLIPNGNFDDEPVTNPQELSDYNYSQYYVGVGQFSIGNNPESVNSWFQPIKDKFTPNGNMMIVDGASTPNVVAYQVEVDVMQGEEYVFSAWLANIHDSLENPFELQFYIDGIGLGEIHGYESNEWFRFHNTWGPATEDKTITIELRNISTQTNGNDFALDELIFAEVCTDQAEIIVKPVPKVELKDTVITEGNTATIRNNVSGGSGIIASRSWAGPTQIIDDINIREPNILATAPAGSYSLTYQTTDANGCPALDSMNITIKKRVIIPDIDTAICPYENYTLPEAPAGLTYTWTNPDGQIISALPPIEVNDEGVYTVLVTNIAGVLAGTGSVDITHLPIPVLNLENDTIKEGVSITINNTIGGGSGTIKNHLWTGPTEILDASDVREPVVLATAPAGIYLLKYKVADANGCLASDTISIVIKETPTIPNTSVSICPNESFTLPKATVGFNYSWTDNYGNPILSPDPIEVWEEGEYHVVVTESSGAFVGNGAIRINFSPLPVLNLTDTIFKEGSDIRLRNTITGILGTIKVHNWSGATEILEETKVQEPVIISNAAHGVYSLNYEVVDTNECVVRDNMNIYITEDYKAPNQKVSICPDGNYKLPKARGNFRYEWKNPQNEDITSSIPVNEKGIYSVSVIDTADNIVSSGSITITHYAIPSPKLNGGKKEMEICPGNSLYIYAGKYRSYLWDDSSTVHSKQVTGAGIKSFVTVTDSNGCKGVSDTVITIAMPKPEYHLEQDAVICPHSSVNLRAAENYLDYTWEHNGMFISNNQIIEVTDSGTYKSIVFDGCYNLTSEVNILFFPQPKFHLIDTTEPAELHVTASGGEPPYLFSLTGQENPYSSFSEENHLTKLRKGKYELFVMDNNQCLNSTTIYVAELKISIPNFFTPNNDGYNDTWEIKYLELEPGSEIWIFDRFGNTIKKYKYGEYKWDGTSNGNPLPQATYWYVIKVPGIQTPFKGSISIKR